MNLNSLFAELPAGHVTTIAGAPHETGVPAKEAHVGWPIGVVRRADGDLIVADWHANRLWRIDGEGILHAFAGDGVPGNRGDGGPALEARLRGPHSLTLDRRGNIYTADLANRTIRRIDAETGIITRVAGSGRGGRGGDGGPALEAELDVHCGIAVDAADNLYLSSEWQNTIRKVDAGTGIIELFAGHDARHYPSEKGRSRPYLGKGLEDWGGLSWGGYHGDGGPAADASFYHPEHLAFDSRGDLYVCDNSNHRIRRIDMATGIITTVLGNGMPSSNGDGGPATEASTLMPDAICLDAHDNLFVGEKYGYRVRRVDAATGIVTTLVGTGVPGWGDEGVHGSEAACNSVEAGILADPDGTVFWCDCSGRMRRYDGETGIVTTVLGGTSIHDGEPARQGFLAAPSGIDAGPDGHVYFADTFNQRVRAIDPVSGRIRTVAGNGARAFGGDGGPAPEAYLSNPADVSVDARGRVVIADTRHGYVRRVDEGGIIPHHRRHRLPVGQGGRRTRDQRLHAVGERRGPRTGGRHLPRRRHHRPGAPHRRGDRHHHHRRRQRGARVLRGWRARRRRPHRRRHRHPLRRGRPHVPGGQLQPRRPRGRPGRDDLHRRRHRRTRLLARGHPPRARPG